MEECRLYKKQGLYSDCKELYIFLKSPHLFKNENDAVFTGQESILFSTSWKNKCLKSLKTNFWALKYFSYFSLEIINWRIQNIYMNVLSDVSSDAMQKNLTENKEVNLIFLTEFYVFI